MLSEEERKELVRGGFDLTEPKVVATKQFNNLHFTKWSGNVISIRFGSGPQAFLNGAALLEWLSDEPIH